METRQLTALLQLSSPALPIGGYSYSQGFEAAVDQGIVSNEDNAGKWIQEAETFDIWVGADSLATLHADLVVVASS